MESFDIDKKNIPLYLYYASEIHYSLKQNFTVIKNNPRYVQEKTKAMREILASALSYLALQCITFCCVIITSVYHSEKERAKADLTCQFFQQNILNMS